MTEQDKNKEERSKKSWSSLPSHGRIALGIAILASILFHVTSFVPLNYYSNYIPPRQVKTPMKVRVVQSQQPKPKDQLKQDQEKPDPDAKKIVETPMMPTKPPKDAKNLGAQDHATEHETKLKNPINQDRKAADAGQKGNPNARPEPPQPETPPTQEQKQVKQDLKSPKEMVVGPERKSKVPQSKLEFDGKIPMLERPKPRNAYEAMLPSSKDLYGQVNAGYQEYIDDAIDEGDRIDLNTAEYKYISYFTKLRKAISLVWVYPSDASRRGMQGEVLVEWIIQKDGSVRRVRVVKSSGYDILDEAIVTAIKLASPFPNLPDAWKVERKVIVGTFKYVLTDYAGTH